MAKPPQAPAGTGIRPPGGQLDALDLALLAALREHPRAGALHLSRITGVARATVQARLDRMEKTGVITGYGPEVDVAAAGFGVRAFVTLEIAQGALGRVAADLTAIPGVLEAHSISGSADVVCMVAAMSHADLQQTLLRIDSSPSVARSTSAIVLSTVIGRRDLPLLASREAAIPARLKNEAALRLRDALAAASFRRCAPSLAGDGDAGLGGVGGEGQRLLVVQLHVAAVV